ncbi:MAG: ATP-binding cassette domain-containing protein [Pseudomonadota bacterium]
MPTSPEFDAQPLLSLRRHARPFAAFALELHSGEKVGLYGINGSGKSTLLRRIAGLQPSSNIDIRAQGKLAVGYQAQHPPRPLGWPISVADYLRIAKLSAQVLPERLQALLHTRCDALSGGQFQQLALCVTLNSPADLILLDEPTHHLDQAGAAWLSASLGRHHATMLMVSHDSAWLALHCTRLVELPPLPHKDEASA